MGIPRRFITVENRSNDVERATTAAAVLGLDVYELLDSLQVRRQRAAVALGGARITRLGRNGIQPGLHVGDRGIDLLARKLELIGIQLL